MGFVFRKSIKLVPGLRLNVSKRGFGISTGVRGARLSISSRGRVTGTVGIPGSGMRYTESVNLKSKQKSKNIVTSGENEFKINGLNLHSREETTAYLEGFDANKTKFFKYGGRVLLILLLVIVTAALIGQGNFAGGVAAVAWFLGVALLASYIRRVIRSKRSVSKRIMQSKEKGDLQ